MKSFLFAMTCAAVIPVQAQYNNPESVEYDASQDRYLVSNSNGGTIVQRDQQGVVTPFASVPGGGPHGIEILGNTVYACNGGSVKGFDLASGTMVFDLNLGGTFLNGITTNDTDLFVTDFSASRIYKIDVANTTFSTLVANTAGTPNGIVYDALQDLLWVVFWGSNAAIKQVDPHTGAINTFTTTSLSNIDGVTLDCFNNLYVASWTPDAITMFPAGSTVGTNMGWSVNNPADIDYDAVNHRICIPNTGTNSVSLELVANCATALPEGEVAMTSTVHPNPAMEVLHIRSAMKDVQDYSIIDAIGSVKRKGTWREGEVIDIHELASGAYILAIGKERIRFQKR